MWQFVQDSTRRIAVPNAIADAKSEAMLLRMHWKFIFVSRRITAENRIKNSTTQVLLLGTGGVRSPYQTSELNKYGCAMLRNTRNFTKTNRWFEVIIIFQCTQEKLGKHTCWGKARKTYVVNIRVEIVEWLHPTPCMTMTDCAACALSWCLFFSSIAYVYSSLNCSSWGLLMFFSGNSSIPLTMSTMYASRIRN